MEVYKIINKRLITNCEYCNAPKDILKIFVEPIISRKSSQDISQLEKKDKLEVNEILELSKNIIFLGRKESGKTTLINYLILKNLKKYIYDEKIPVYITGSELEKNTFKLEKSIFYHLNNLNFDECSIREVKEFLQAGTFIIFIDDINLKKSKEKIEEIQKLYPINQFILSVKEEYGELELDLKKEIDKLNFEKEILYIGSLDGIKVRELSLKWLQLEEIENSKVEGLLKNIQKIGIPMTPQIVSLLLWINEKQIRYNPVNKASILQVFFDIILEKLNFDKMFEKIDFDEKLNYLSFIATEMRKDNKRSYPITLFEEKSIEHLKALKVANIEISTFVKYFIDRGILIKLDEKVGFKYESFYEFFIAKKMSEDDSYRDEILIETEYYLMPEEIEYYSGIRRESTVVLEKLNSYLNNITGEIKEESLNEYVFKIKPLHPQNEKILEEEEMNANANEIIRLPFKEQIRWGYNKKEQSKEESFKNRYMSTLKLLSCTFRNCTLTKDVELREKIYFNLLKNYSILLITANKEFDKESTKIIEADFFKFFTTAVLTEFASDTLISDRLEMFLKESKKSKIKVIEFLSIIMLLDGQFEDCLIDVEKYIESEKNILFLEVIKLKLYKYLMLRNCLKNPEKEKVKSILKKIMYKLEKISTKRVGYSYNMSKKEQISKVINKNIALLEKRK